jgi:hypothetical protein
MTQPADWHTTHVYYHEPDRSCLLLQAVRPLLHEISSDVIASYVIPHWKRGPHLRININVSPQVWSRTVRPAVEHFIGGYLTQHPSTTDLNEEGFLAQHRKLAELERETGPLFPWAPDNTIEYSRYVSRAEQMGGQSGEELVTDFYVASTPFHFETVRHLKDTGQPTDLTGLSLLFTTAEAVGGLGRNAGSFRSHAEGFLGTCADPDSARAVFERQYTRHHDAIHDLMHTVVATLSATAGLPHPLAAQWAALLRRCLERAEPALREGVMRTSEAERRQLIDNPAFPAYQRRAVANDSYFVNALGNIEFQRYRLALNFTYLQLTRMGIPPSGRFLLCHLAANAIEDYHGTSSINFINSYVAAHS